MPTDGERIAVLESQIPMFADLMKQVSIISGQLMVMQKTIENSDNNAIQARALMAEALKETTGKVNKAHARLDDLVPIAKQNETAMVALSTKVDGIETAVDNLNTWKDNLKGAGTIGKYGWALLAGLIVTESGVLTAVLLKR